MNAHITKQQLATQMGARAGKLETMFEGFYIEEMLHNILKPAVLYSYNILMNYPELLYFNKKESLQKAAQEIFSLSQSTLFKQDKEIEIQQLILRIVMDFRMEDFMKLKSFLFASGAYEMKYRTDIASILINAANEHVEQYPQLLRQLFEIYKYKFTQKLIYKHSGVTYIALYRAVSVGLELGKRAEAKKILKENYKYCSPDVREAIYRLCLAKISYAGQNIFHTLDLLLKVETANLYIKYELRCLQTQVYYYMKEYLLLQAHLEAFRQFLNYNKTQIFDNVKEARMHFIELLKKLVAENFRKKHGFSQKLKKEIAERPQVYLRHWLLEKVREVS